MKHSWLKWLALACLAGLLAGCIGSTNERDLCEDVFYLDAHSERVSDSVVRLNLYGDTDVQTHGQCARRQPASPASNDYVIRQNRLYAHESQFSSRVKCVAGVLIPLVWQCLLGEATYSTEIHHFFPLELEPDPGAFRVLDEHHGVVNGKVYFRQFVILDGRPLPEQEPMRVLSLPANNARQRRESDYAVYGDQVFFKNWRVDGADAASFQALYLPHDDPGDERLVFSYDFARDKHRVYWKNLMLDDSDPESFEVVDHGAVKDRRHLWRVAYGAGRQSLGVDASEMPQAEPLGGGFFRSHFTSPQGQPYARVQWRGGDGQVAWLLPLGLSEGDEFTVLPTGCSSEAGTLDGYPEMACAHLDHRAISDFGRTRNQVFFRAWEVMDADVASFRVIAAAVDSGGRQRAFALDARHVHSFWDAAFPPRSTPRAGQAAGPIPNRDGVFRLLSSGAELYDFIDGGNVLGLADLCRYDDSGSADGLQGGPQISARNLKVASRDEGRDGRSWIELANDRYRYVFYAAPTGDANPSHVIDLRTGRRLRMGLGTAGSGCGPQGAAK